MARVRAGVTPGWAWEVVQLLRLPLPVRPGLVARLFTAAEQRGAEQERERLLDALRILARDSLEGYDRALVAVGERLVSLHDQEGRDTRHLRRGVDELAARVLSPDGTRERVQCQAAGLPGWTQEVVVGLRERLRAVPPSLDWLRGLGAAGRVGGRGGPAPPAGTIAALARELIPWLLGVGDPLRERAERALDEVRVASPCDVPWEDMPGDERTRVCGECRMTVYDLSALDRAEAAALLRQHQGQRLCVQLYRRADGRIHTRDCPVDPTLARRTVKGMRA